MPNEQINIALKLTDEFTNNFKKFGSQLEQVTQKGEAFGREMRKVGREISYVSSSMVMLGGAITAPMILAFKSASQYSAPMLKTINQLNNEFQNLQRTIAEAILPVVQNLVDIFGRVVDKFMEFDPVLREHILKMTFLGGVILVVAGTFGVLIGRIVATAGILVMLASQFAMLLVANPILAGILASIGLIIIAMLKWKWVADTLLNTFEFVLTTIAGVFEWIKSGLWQLYSWIQRIFQTLAEWGSKLPKKFGGDMFKDLADQFKQSADASQEFATKDLELVFQRLDHLKSMVQGTADTWGKGFNKMKVSVGDFKKMLTDAMRAINELMTSQGGEKPKSGQKQVGFFDGFMAGIEQANEALSNFAQIGKDTATSMVNAMSGAFSSFFNDVFTGQLKKGTDYFRAFGQALIKIFADVLAKLVAKWITSGIMQMFSGGSKGSAFGSVLGALGGLSYAGSAFSGAGGGFATVANTGAGFQGLSYSGGGFHKGGIIKAHGGLAVDEVPIIAQRGERVLSREQNRRYEKGGDTFQPVLIIKAWDYSDIIKHKAEIEAIIESSIRKNSSLRQTIKQYS